ncbi:MAG: NAD-dependent epimerase/dehydratase family protein [Candidatus Eisenbacteria sp.]|nr:NAD-dependent epimerase/dehydratase family protein [Candidatus Eisenbacteria bacterium]
MAVAVVTGAAGFIGSSLSTRLLDEGIRVRGIDNFDPYYDRKLKERNLRPLLARDTFEFREGDLGEIDLNRLLQGAEWVFHQAARAGVRRSWGADFSAYVKANVLATQRLLEALREHPVERVIFASSSSVYGEGPGGPATEDAPCQPISPYGVTKLAGEKLVAAYRECYGLPTISLRYFTVYGPGQRPDMAFHRFVRAILEGRGLEVFGDGRQTRDFTFIADAVSANLLAARNGVPGGVYNIGGGSPASVLDVIHTLEAIIGRGAEVCFLPAEAGDPRATSADTAKARDELGFQPTVSLEEGLRQMTGWMSQLLQDPSFGNRH